MKALSSKSQPNYFFKSGLAILLAASAGSAATIFDSGNVALTAASPVQTGRLAFDESSTPSQWFNEKPFPGAAASGKQFHYDVFPVQPGPYAYLQITFDAQKSDTFASAYLNTYAPGQTGPYYSLNDNYLGDAGGAGTYFSNSRAFQVTVPDPERQEVLIVVNDVSDRAASLNQSFRLLVEGFTDTSYDDIPVPTPEPASAAISAVGLLGAIAFLWRRNKAL